MNRLGWIDQELAELDEAHLIRRRITCQPVSDALLEIEGRTFVNFGSNDYLGLAGDPRVVAAARQDNGAQQWGATASPLLTGRHPAHDRLEAALAEFEQCEAALLFPSGFAANLGAITALVGPGDAIFSDAKNHASIIDGCRLSRAEVFIYPHPGPERLEEMLRAAKGYRRRLIVTDGLFSMDGDLAPLADLADLARRFEAMLMVDEAHATGVFGEAGRGAGEFMAASSGIDVRVGTLSKALGSAGGFVAGSKSLIEWLVNRARSYIFSTALPVGCCTAAQRALEIVIAEPWRRERLLDRATKLRSSLSALGWTMGASQSQIVPLIVGEEAAALELSAQLRRSGLWVPAVRWPSVAPGEARLRISLSYAHTPEMIDTLVAALDRLARRNPAGAAQA